MEVAQGRSREKKGEQRQERSVTERKKRVGKTHSCWCGYEFKPLLGFWRTKKGSREPTGNQSRHRGRKGTERTRARRKPRRQTVCKTERKDLRTRNTTNTKSTGFGAREKRTVWTRVCGTWQFLCRPMVLPSRRQRSCWEVPAFFWHRAGRAVVRSGPRSSTPLLPPSSTPPSYLAYAAGLIAGAVLGHSASLLRTRKNSGQHAELKSERSDAHQANPKLARVMITTCGMLLLSFGVSRLTPTCAKIGKARYFATTGMKTRVRTSFRLYPLRTALC